MSQQQQGNCLQSHRSQDSEAPFVGVSVPWERIASRLPEGRRVGADRCLPAHGPRASRSRLMWGPPRRGHRGRTLCPCCAPLMQGYPDVMWLQARFVAKNCCEQPQRAQWSAGVDASVLVPNPFHREGKSTRSAGREADSCRTRTACDDQLHRLGGTDGEGRREKRLPSLKDSCPPSRFPTEMRNFNQCWAAASPLIFPSWRRADRFFQTLRRPPPRDRHASRS